ncbi:hypothetical protein FGB62_46g04 [Gracilaria domingensis]|nr:hypothetical protein FGB62_46g04 [Gracilaria domingensis]
MPQYRPVGERMPNLEHAEFGDYLPFGVVFVSGKPQCAPTGSVYFRQSWSRSLSPAAPVLDVAVHVEDPGVADVPATCPDIVPAGPVPAVIPVASAAAPSAASPGGRVGSEAAATPHASVISYSIRSVACIGLAPGGAFSPEVGAALAALQEEFQNRGVNSPDSLLGSLTAARLWARDSALLRVISQKAMGLRIALLGVVVRHANALAVDLLENISSGFGLPVFPLGTAVRVRRATLSTILAW